jgi:hypothetical protein
MTMSLDGANENVEFAVDAASAEVLRDLTENVGAIVAGRHLFDITNGWNVVQGRRALHLRYPVRR